MAAASKEATGRKNAPKAKKGAKGADVQQRPAAREGSKKQAVLAILQRKGGGSLNEIMAATDWQAHYADVQIMPTCVGHLAFGAGIAAMESA